VAQTIVVSANVKTRYVYCFINTKQDAPVVIEVAELARSGILKTDLARSYGSRR
jgi:hypothetical protein